MPSKVEQRINIITLGVKDLQKSKNFYEKGLGWNPSSASNEHILFFDMKGLVLALFSEEALADDATVPRRTTNGFRGQVLAYNVADKESVKKVLAEAKKAGATIVKEAQDVFWGGYSGYFADPDEHLWEVAWNPFWPLDKEGKVQLPA